MHKGSNIIRDISPLTRLIILILYVICIVVSHSIYLTLFLTTLICIMCIITSKKVNTYVNFIKKVLILLLIFLIIYIIICREYNYIKISWFLYKEVLIAIIIKIYDINTTFKELDEAIFCIIKPIKHIKSNDLSYNISLSIYLIKFWLNSRNNIIEKEQLFAIERINFKNRICSRIIFTINKINEFDVNHRLNFYNLKYQKMDLKSKIVLMVFSLFFIICMFKEVIL